MPESTINKDEVSMPFQAQTLGYEKASLKSRGCASD